MRTTRQQNIRDELQQLMEENIIEDWRYINGIWDLSYYDEWAEDKVAVPMTTAQVEAFLSGVSTGMGWVKRVAREVEEGKAGATVDA